MCTAARDWLRQHVVHIGAAVESEILNLIFFFSCFCALWNNFMVDYIRTCITSWSFFQSVLFFISFQLHTTLNSCRLVIIDNRRKLIDFAASRQYIPLFHPFFFEESYIRREVTFKLTCWNLFIKKSHAIIPTNGRAVRKNKQRCNINVYNGIKEPRSKFTKKRNIKMCESKCGATLITDETYDLQIFVLLCLVCFY